MIVNLTPYAITLHLDGRETTIEPSGTVAKVTEQWGKYPTYDPIAGLPEPSPGVRYIVSYDVFSVAKALGRWDVLAPKMDNAAYDHVGRVVTVDGFVL